MPMSGMANTAQSGSKQTVEMDMEGCSETHSKPGRQPLPPPQRQPFSAPRSPLRGCQSLRFSQVSGQVVDSARSKAVSLIW